MRQLGWLVALTVLATSCVDEPDSAIPEEVRRSIALVEPELSMFDELFGEPDYQASTLEACIDGDLYETRSYPVNDGEVDLDVLRQQLQDDGWDMFEGTDEFASNSTSIRGSTHRGEDRIDIRVSFHDTPARQAVSVDLLFRSLALDLC